MKMKKAVAVALILFTLFVINVIAIGLLSAHNSQTTINQAKTLAIVNTGNTANSNTQTSTSSTNNQQTQTNTNGNTQTTTVQPTPTRVRLTRAS